MHTLTQGGAAPLSQSLHKSVLIVSKPWGSGLKTSFLLSDLINSPSCSSPLSQSLRCLAGDREPGHGPGDNNELLRIRSEISLLKQRADKDVNPRVLIGQIKSITGRSSCLHPVLVSAPGPHLSSPLIGPLVPVLASDWSRPRCRDTVTL